MSNKLFFLISLALVLALSGFARAEILLNPGFEDGDEFWNPWGGGSGSGAGGYFWDSSYGSTVIEDGTAHGGDKYLEAILNDIGLTGWWWNGMWVMTNYPVTEGKTYEFGAWVRDGDADGATSLIPGGIEITYEWRVAPPDSPTGPRYDEVDPDGDGNTGEHRNNTTFDLTGQWTYVSAQAVAPETAQGVTIGLVARVGIRYDVDDASFIEVGGQAREPSPADGTFLEQTWANLAWTPGNLADSHNIYVGDNFDDVKNGAGDTFRANQTGDFYTIGFGDNPYPDGLVHGMTYYWRIDEVNESEPDSPWEGKVWSFTITPKTAYMPNPSDGTESINMNTQLSWTAGFQAKIHYIVFGEDYDEVNNTEAGTAVGTTNYTPDTLKLAKTYYWRVDEFDGTETHKGEIWSFTTEGAVSGANPADGAVDVKPSVTLSWDAGAVAASHEVYFGSDADAVANATKASPEYKGPKALGEESYDPGILALNTTYFWRIEEVNGVNPDSPWPGNVWSFTTSDYFVIDDFEDYNAGENQIWFSWHDGLGAGTPGNPGYIPGNGTGSAVGDENTLSYTEETIVNGGLQSMPFEYDNNKQGFAYYSEVELTLTDQRDWTEEGVAELSLWFRGNPASVGSFVEGPLGTYTMTGSGADIWGQSDQFHFAYKTLSGQGSIAAKVESLSDTHEWAKAGVMIRESLDADSKHAMMIVSSASGVSYQRRIEKGGDSTNDDAADLTAPYWVKIERDLAGNITAYSSANGSSWQKLGVSESIQMGAKVHIGLAVTSHNASETCEAVFTNVTTSANVTGQWANQDIGIVSNDTEPLYVALSNSTGVPAVVTHDDPAASNIDTWTEWIIPLQAFADQGIVLTDVDKIAIGLGTRDNTTVPGGAGKMYIDDVRLFLPGEAAE